MEKRYGRSGKYTEKEWQGVIATKRHEAKVATRFQPTKDAIMQQVRDRLAAAGVSAEKINTVAALIKQDRLAIITWSSAAMKQAVCDIQSWYEESIGAIAYKQIEADNEIYHYGE